MPETRAKDLAVTYSTTAATAAAAEVKQYMNSLEADGGTKAERGVLAGISTAVGVLGSLTSMGIGIAGLLKVQKQEADTETTYVGFAVDIVNYSSGAVVIASGESNSSSSSVEGVGKPLATGENTTIVLRRPENSTQMDMTIKLVCGDSSMNSWTIEFVYRTDSNSAFLYQVHSSGAAGGQYSLADKPGELVRVKMDDTNSGSYNLSAYTMALDNTNNGTTFLSIYNQVV